jgi:23S rRNA pseudoU1915 N3-methylase RlmH
MKIKIISIGNNPPKWVQDILVKYISRFDTHFKIKFIDPGNRDCLYLALSILIA